MKPARNIRPLQGSVAHAVTLVLAIVMAAVAAGTGRAQSSPAAKPQFSNAKLEERAAASLARDVDAWAKSSQQPRWLGYYVPAADRDRQTCCNDNGNWNHGCGLCRLENGDHGINFNNREGNARLEGPADLAILYRAENARIGKIRVISEGCAIDAGGLSVTWLTGVPPADSIKLLESFVEPAEFGDHDHRHLSRDALMAIALHDGPSADQAFARFTASDKPEGLRKDAAFWAGEARGSAGLELLKRMAKQDASNEVRAQVTFALSVSRELGAVDEMIRMAHQDASAHVRGQALFWLAQKAGKKAEGAITGAIENDPDTEVKKKAVFALSQMPKDEGVPKLIQVAQNNRNAEVRKQAMFWLGQTNDPRALEFFEKVLSK
jgi:hypothetical protein